MKKFLSLLFAKISIYSCKDKEIIGPQVVPFSLFFVIKENGNRLDDKTLDNMKLFYFNGSNKTYINDFMRATDGGRTLGV
ncbi:MAG: hypothetical protein IPL97_11615 [Niastella sp.]|nr:hypothetical protein [Niastella sp.]